MNKGSYYVIDILQSFTKKELANLQALANSNYFNTEKKVIALVDILIKKIKVGERIDENNLSTIYNELYNTDLVALNATQSSNVYSKMSLLYDLLQQFLMLLALQKSEKTKAYLLQEELLERKLYRSFKKFIKLQRKILAKAEVSVEFYEQQFVIENAAFNFAQLTGNISKQNNISLVKDSLTLYYLLHQMDAYLIELYLNELSSNYKADTLYYQAIQPFLKLPQFATHPLLQVYQSVIKLMETKTENSFFQLVKDIEFYDQSIPLNSQIIFYTSLLNFCVLQVRNGKTEYFKNQFNLYKTMDAKNLLLADNQIQVGNLHNIITVSCKVKDFDWAIKMLDKYYFYLQPNIRDAAKEFNLGAIAYYQKNYQQAIDYLFPLPTINLSHDINRRTIIMKAYYELDPDYLETTHTLFRTFEKYIREHKNLTSKSKRSYKNFIRTLINLYRIKHRVTKMKLENIKQKLEAQKLNSNKSWLFDKIEELKI